MILKLCDLYKMISRFDEKKFPSSITDQERYDAIVYLLDKLEDPKWVTKAYKYAKRLYDYEKP